METISRYKEKKWYFIRLLILGILGIPIMIWLNTKYPFPWNGWATLAVSVYVLLFVVGLVGLIITKKSTEK